MLAFLVLVPSFDPVPSLPSPLPSWPLPLAPPSIPNFSSCAFPPLPSLALFLFCVGSARAIAFLLGLLLCGTLCLDVHLGVEPIVAGCLCNNEERKKQNNQQFATKQEAKAQRITSTLARAKQQTSPTQTHGEQRQNNAWGPPPPLFLGGVGVGGGGGWHVRTEQKQASKLSAQRHNQHVRPRRATEEITTQASQKQEIQEQGFLSSLTQQKNKERKTIAQETNQKKQGEWLHH